MLAVAGGKGGCGKTTTTACLARGLADDGAAPIIVDADVDMPDLHAVAGAHLEPGIDSLAAGGRIEDVTQSTLELPGVRLVAGGTGSTDQFDAALTRLRNVSDPVLVDTAAGASPEVARPLRAADATVIVSTPTTESLEDAAKTAAMARTLDAPVVGGIITRSDGTVDPRSLFDCSVIGHVPTAETPLTDPGVRDAYASVVETLPSGIFNHLETIVSPRYG